MNDTSKSSVSEAPPVLGQSSLGLGYLLPQQVLDDARLTIEEKRAILAGWASDAFAVEDHPALRRLPGGGQLVSIDEILEALRSLDRQVDEFVISPPRRLVRRAAVEAFRAARCHRPCSAAMRPCAG